MHAHSYLGSMPFYMLAMIMVINWSVAIKLFSLDWQGQIQFVPMETLHGGEDYLATYLTFMVAFGVVPYLEENFRCLRYQLKHGSPQ